MSDTIANSSLGGAGSAGSAGRPAAPPSNSVSSRRDRERREGGKRPRAAAAAAGPGAAAAAELPEHRRTVHIMQAINRGFTRVFHRLEVLAPCRLPKSGPAIIVCNHTSGLDPHLIQACSRRLITWMMAKEYYDQRSVNYLLRELGVIPVTRSGRDMMAMRLAMRALENGQLLGVFPEGRIELSRELMPFQTGVALMAMKTNVPIYPAFLDGNQRNTTMLSAFFKPHRARIIFGDEVCFDRSDDSRAGLEQATAAIKSAVESLRSEMDKRVTQRGL